MKKTLAIVSSYNETCGNASYTEVLRREFSKYYNVEIIPLDIEILTSRKKPLKKLAELHILDIARQLKSYDYVNIQFEAGLYGSSADDICRRTEILIKASQNLIITMHRVDVRDGFSFLQFMKALLQRQGFQNVAKMYINSQADGIYEKVVSFAKKHSKNHNVNIIVHTKRERNTIKRLFDFANVYDFPLTFLDAAMRQRTPKAQEKSQFKKKYGFAEKDIIIGVFGFITEYKGHETAIRALEHLPDNYKLGIFGSQHPMSYKSYTLIDEYINKLIKIIENKSNVNKQTLKDRIFFAGNLNDEDFINSLYCCDFAVLPYMEVNQSGSGIASLVLESKIKSLYSNNKTFMELAHYYPHTFETFDMGNYLELAYKIKNYTQDYRQNLEQYLETYNIENNIKMHCKLFAKKEQI